MQLLKLIGIYLSIVLNIVLFLRCLTLREIVDRTRGLLGRQTKLFEEYNKQITEYLEIIADQRGEVKKAESKALAWESEYLRLKSVVLKHMPETMIPVVNLKTDSL